ncbi:MAG: hypothetical protein ACE5OR_08650 [bacterium]
MRLFRGAPSSVLLAGVLSFTIGLPTPGVGTRVQVLSTSPFGVAFGSVYRGEAFMDFINELGAKGTKIYVSWRQVEPQRGEYDWGVVDTFLSQLGPNSESLIAIWTSSSWGTKPRRRIRGGAPPQNMEAYYDFIFNLVRHCQGKIKYWQNDCEPNSPMFWEGTKEEFVSTLKVFHKAVKKADPRAEVIVGGHSGAFSDRGTPDNQKFFDYVFEKGRDSFDLFDIRLYGDPYTIPYRVDWFRNRMLKFDCQKPIVCTEYGGPLPTQFPEGQKLRNRYFKNRSREEKREMFKEILKKRHLLRPQMRMFLEGCEGELEEKRHRIHCRDIVARTVIALSAGVKKMWYWDLVNDPHPLFGKFRLMDRNFETKYPAYYTYQRMVEKMKDATSIKQREVQKRSNIYLFEVERRDRDPLYIVWERRDLFNGEDQPPTQLELPFDFEKVRITDVFGMVMREETEDGVLKFGVTDTPLFIEADESD